MKRVRCQCCGYPTLERRGYDEICMLCDWQDDSKEEGYAKKVLGGPNGEYSLEEARNNFNAYLSMYRENEINDAERYLVERKKGLILAYESLKTPDGRAEEEKWKRITELEQGFYRAKYGDDK